MYFPFTEMLGWQSRRIIPFSATSLSPLRSLNRRPSTPLFPGLGQLWLSLGLSLLLAPPCGIVFRQPLAIPFSQNSNLSTSLALLKTCLFSRS